MNIAIIGATGKAGHLIMEEALQRGHQVTAVVRDAAKVKEKVNVIEKDIFDLTVDDLNKFDAVVDAFGSAPGKEEMHQTTLAHLADILSGQQTRLLVVGGAASLYIDDAETMRMIDKPGFSEAFKPLALNMVKAFDQLKTRDDVNWTYLSPSASFNATGASSGTYRIGKDRLLFNHEGESTISYADYAIALVDEIENGNHIKQRFTVVEQ